MTQTPKQIAPPSAPQPGHRSLYGRFAIGFVLVLLIVGGLFGWRAMVVADQQQRQALQSLSADLARQIVENGGLVDAEGMKQASVDALFDGLMRVNPNIEVYLLDPAGKIIGDAPTKDPVLLKQVDLEKIQTFLNGGTFPLRGTNPRHPEQPEIFSAAPIDLQGDLPSNPPGAVSAHRVGYVYIVLINGSYRQQLAAMQAQAWWQQSGWIALSLVLLGGGAGLAMFILVTRRLNRLRQRVDAFERHWTQLTDATPTLAPSSSGDEIDHLDLAFTRLTERLHSQMNELRRQDGLRRELVANVSHDLRTPLTSMQNYLETLQRMGAQLAPEQQQQYLDIAVRQSRQVARLAQQLFELALLELEDTPVHREPFPIAELIHDLAQKFALQAEQAGIQLDVAAAPATPWINGDIGLIERMLANFTDNALRHTSADGRIQLSVAVHGGQVQISVQDTGSGIEPERLATLFERRSPLRHPGQRRSGGLGLLIAQRIAQLHGFELKASSVLGQGSCFTVLINVHSAAKRLGFMHGEFTVPKDFDQIGQAEIQNMFEGKA